jgi:hypothetical protein
LANPEAREVCHQEMEAPSLDVGKMDGAKTKFIECVRSGYAKVPGNFNSKDLGKFDVCAYKLRSEILKIVANTGL